MSKCGAYARSTDRRQLHLTPVKHAHLMPRALAKKMGHLANFLMISQPMLIRIPVVHMEERQLHLASTFGIMFQKACLRCRK